jgi:hypothetical protein
MEQGGCQNGTQEELLIRSINNNIKGNQKKLSTEKQEEEMKVKKLVPEDFEPSHRHYEIARERGWPDPDEEYEKFIEHHVAAGNKFANVDMAFTKWLRKAAEFKNKNNKGRSNENNKSGAQNLLDALGEDFRKEIRDASSSRSSFMAGDIPAINEDIPF